MLSDLLAVPCLDAWYTLSRQEKCHDSCRRRVVQLQMHVRWETA
jgi:hypothetical protein